MLSARTLLLTFLAFFYFLPQNGLAQKSAFSCATDEVHQRLKERSPQDAKRIEVLEEEMTQQRKDFDEGQRAGQVYTIPVVFHIIHDNGPENVSADVVEDALEQLNNDFRKKNGDTSDIVSSFQSLAADSEIEFRLAQKDPNGNCHRGITRTRSDLTYEGNTDMKYLIQWDPSMYMNVWICNTIQGGAAGYALKPSGAQFFQGRDGIVVQYNYFGQGERTLTHEAGHYLSLDHTWGSKNDGAGDAGDAGNCNYDDGINDTPNTIGWFHCNDPSGSSCSSQDNVQNYMEYSFCHRMFTPDQANAMRSALNSSTADRNQLWQSSNLQATGTDGIDVICKAWFSVKNRMVCVGEPVDFSDRSFHGPTSWNWDFHGGNPNDPNAQNPTVTYNNTGIYDVSLTVSNSNGSADTTLENYIKVVPKPGYPLPFIETFDWPKVPLAENDQYIVTDLNDDGLQWKWTDEAGEGGSRGSIMLNNFDNEAGKVDLFETASIDATTLSSSVMELSFDLAYAKKNSGDGDELIIHASNDCGKTWSQRGKFTTNDMETASPTTDPFTPNNDQWVKLKINNSLTSTYNVEDLRFRFEFISDGGNNVYIDNINVHDENNVGIEESEKGELGFSVRPNPVKEKAVLDFRLRNKGDVRIEVRDLLGKKVLGSEHKSSAEGAHRMGIDMSTLDAGPYFVILYAEGERSTQKVFKR